MLSGIESRLFYNYSNIYNANLVSEILFDDYNNGMAPPDEHININ